MQCGRCQLQDYQSFKNLPLSGGEEGSGSIPWLGKIYCLIFSKWLEFETIFPKLAVMFPTLHFDYPVILSWFFFESHFHGRVPTVLEKSLNFGFSLKSSWKWICPWKVLEFRRPSLKFQLAVLDFLFCVFSTESLNGYSKLRGTRANFPPKNSAGFARSSLQVKYCSSSSCSYI